MVAGGGLVEVLVFVGVLGFVREVDFLSGVFWECGVGVLEGEVFFGK